MELESEFLQIPDHESFIDITDSLERFCAYYQYLVDLYEDLFTYTLL